MILGNPRWFGLARVFLSLYSWRRPAPPASRSPAWYWTERS